MTSTRPPSTLIFGSLLRADVAVLSRSWRLQVLNLGLPLVVLGANWLQRQGKPVDAGTAASLIGIAVTAGLLAAGVLGYPLSIARDRENGVFQRLRVTPTPAWMIMISRLVLLVVVDVVVAVVVGTLGGLAFRLSLGVVQYLLLVPAGLVTGMVFLGLGQALAGLLTSATLINAVGRVVFLVLFLVGLFGLTGVLGTQLETAARWSPVESTVDLFRAALFHGAWINPALTCLGYILVFGFLGIRYFRWDAT